MISERQPPRSFSVAAGRMWGWQANESRELWNKPIPLGNPWQGGSRKTFSLVINPHMLRRETGECGGWWVGGEASDGIFPHDAAAFSACVNKASLNCLIILCKLRDQGTYWKLASKHSAWSVSLAHVFKSFSSTSSYSYSKMNEPWYILMMSRITSAFSSLNYTCLNTIFQLSPTHKKSHTLHHNMCSSYLLVT